MSNLTEAFFYIGQLIVRKRVARVQVKFGTWCFYRSSSVCVVGEGRVYFLKLSLVDWGI